MKIGICGTGRMGSAIAHRLMSVGHEVGVWNRNSARTKPLVDAGAKLFASPAELVQGHEVTIVMLLNDAATEAVYRASNGILKANLAGTLLIDMSTIRPDTMKSNGAAAVQQGAAFVECPVGGTVGPAKEGKLLGLVGGSKSDVARAMPIMEQMCRRIELLQPDYVMAIDTREDAKKTSEYLFDGGREGIREGSRCRGRKDSIIINLILYPGEYAVYIFRSRYTYCFLRLGIRDTVFIPRWKAFSDSLVRDT